MKKVVQLLLIILVSVPVFREAQAQSAGFAWTKQYGGDSYDWGIAIARGVSGSIYLAGVYDSSTTIGLTTLTSGGNSNSHVTKLDSNGVVVWTKNLQSSGLVMVRDIEVDEQENIYVAGHYSDVLTIGGITLVSNYSQGGGAKAFIAKLDSTGQELWAKSSQSPGPLMDHQAHSIATDKLGNAYIMGMITGTAHFGSHTISSGNSSTLPTGTFINGFVVKYDAIGTELWARALGEQNQFAPRAMVADSAGTVYVTGNYTPNSNNSLTLGNITLVSQGLSDDIFLLAINNSGLIQWAKRAGSLGYDNAWAIDNDKSGNLYLTGFVGGNADFDTASVYSSSQNTFFIASYTSAGNVRWVKQDSGTGSGIGYGISVDKYGNSFVTGVFNGLIGLGGIQLSSTGWYDALVAKYNSSGTVIWATATAANGTYSGAGGSSVIPDGAGSCYVLGEFYGQAEFGLDSLANSSVSTNKDIFLSRLGPRPLLRTAAPGFIQTTQGASVQIPYRTDGAFDAGNIFTAELSDASGSFAAPVVIGTVGATAAGQISAIIPVNTPVGDHYRIRVTASAPAKTAPDNGSDLRIGQFLSSAQAQAQNPLQVFPNPFSNGFTLTGNLTEERIELQLIDGLGRVVSYHKQATHLAGTSIEVKTTHLPDGLYLLRVVQGKTVHQATVVKQ